MGIGLHNGAAWGAGGETGAVSGNLPGLKSARRRGEEGTREEEKVGSFRGGGEREKGNARKGNGK